MSSKQGPRRQAGMRTTANAAGRRHDAANSNAIEKEAAS